MSIHARLSVLASAALAFGFLGCGDDSGNDDDDTIDCSTCAANAACTPGESTACGCAPGFEGDGTLYGTGCLDINECTAGTDNCSEPGGTCTNTPGGFACGCAPGYHDGGSLGCLDTDECAAGTDTCTDLPGSTCTNTAGGFACGCAAGYVGDGTAAGTGCTDFDECTTGTDTCVDPIASCTNTAGGFACTCAAGFVGDGTSTGTGCTDVDECLAGTDGCTDGPTGTCTNSAGGFACGCADGFAGDGTTVGTGCTDVDECGTGADSCVDPAGGGTCANTSGGFACGCAAGFVGDGSTTGTGCADLDECALGTDTCVNVGGTCTNTAGGFACGCVPGYVGDGTSGGTGCSDVDECALGTDDCVIVGGTCTNSAGGFACGCTAGYVGDGTTTGTGCTDVNECVANTDDCVNPPIGTCTNVPGDFTCGCSQGYGGDGTAGGTGCTDIDECATHTDHCAPGQQCSNTQGGYTCAGCAAGFQDLNGVCVDINECAANTDTCVDDNAGGLCINTPGSFTCACDEDNLGNGTTVAAGGSGCLETSGNPRLIVPRRLPNDKTLTVRADILKADGHIETSGCYGNLGTVKFTRIADGADIPITVTIFDNHLPVPADSIRFYHGIGSVSFTLDGGAAVPAGDYRVTVTVGGLVAHKVIHVLAAPTWRVMPANLAGADLVWGPHENIRISQHNTSIPAGSTLTILPGTIVMVDTTGGLEDGTLILVNGQLDATGTWNRPLHFFSERGPAAMTHAITSSLSNPNAWRGIFFYNNGSSNLKWTVLTGAGNGVVVSHPRPPILNLTGTHNLTAEDDVLVDSTGMMFQSPGTGTFRIRRSLISRVGIGAEFLSSGHNLLIEDSWWTGIGRGPTTPIRYDGDGIHVDGAGSTQVIRRCIIADIGDDGIDHSNSTFSLEDSIIHGVNDKAISMTGGLVTIRNSLIYDAGSGVRGTAKVYNSTIAVGSSPIANPVVVSESIIWPGSVPTCGPAVDHSIVGNAADLGCGVGNLSANPMFTNPAQCDYTPAAGSPALHASTAGGRIGWLGFTSW